jgi:hypothetical protein
MSVADFLDIDLNAQNLSVIRNGEVCRRFVVSTAKNGPGEQAGSECTPRGWHKIKAKIGARAPGIRFFQGADPPVKSMVLVWLRPFRSGTGF